MDAVRIRDWRLPDSGKGGGRDDLRGCNCGNCHLTILPTGDVYACRRVQNSKVGNVFEDRLADLWICQMEQYRDYAKFEKCAKCRLLAFCRGCPAVASGKDGNFYAADPQCWMEVAG